MDLVAERNGELNAHDLSACFSPCEDIFQGAPKILGRRRGRASGGESALGALGPKSEFRLGVGVFHDAISVGDPESLQAEVVARASVEVFAKGDVDSGAADRPDDRG